MGAGERGGGVGGSCRLTTADDASTAGPTAGALLKSMVCVGAVGGGGGASPFGSQRPVRRKEMVEWRA